MGLNSIALGGRLAADPEVRFTKDNKAFCTFRFAGDPAWYKDDPVWCRVTVWGKRAETVGEYLRKGSRAYLKGSLKGIQTFSKKDGSEGFSLEITADDVDFGEKKQSSGQREMRQGNDESDSDIPF